MDPVTKRVGIYIGRFQPLHNGHMNIIQKGIKECNTFIIVIGSMDKHNEKNPFTYEKRRDVVYHAVLESHLDIDKLRIIGINDTDALDSVQDVPIEQLWYYYLRQLVTQTIPSMQNLYLYASVKDPHTDDYLKKIRQYLNIVEYVEIKVSVNNGENINATDIREHHRNIKSTQQAYMEKIRSMEDNYFQEMSKIVPPSTIALLKNDL